MKSLLTRVGERSLVILAACAAMHAPAAQANAIGPTVASGAGLGSERARGRSIGRDGAGRLNYVFILPDGPGGDPVDLAAIAAVAREVLEQEHETFGLPPGDDLARVSIGEPEILTEQIVRVATHETWRGLRVLGSELSLLFGRDGRFLGAVGRFAGVVDVAAAPSFHVAQAVETLERKGRLAPSARRIERIDRRRHAVRTENEKETVEAERVVAPEHGTVAWELRGPDRTWLVSETSGEILAEREHLAHLNEVIVRRDVVRATLQAHTADWRTSIGDLGTWDPASTKVMKSYLDADNTACRYTLQSGLGSGARNESFPRVDDRSGTDDFVTPYTGHCTPGSFNELPCGLGFQCGPSDGDGSYYRQQTYHSYLAEGLDIVRSGVHPFVAPDSGWDVSLAVDEPLTGACGADAGCFRFSPWFRAVHMTTSNASVAVLWHELGHYFDWTYGWLGGNCNDADESVAVKETLADVFASLLAKRQFDPRYRDRFTRRQYDFGMHSENSNRVSFVAGTQGCIANGTYGMGEAFYQAMWEIAFGFNCDQLACSDTAVGTSTRANAGDIAWATNREASEQLLRSLAFALKNAGSGITFRQLAGLIHIDVGMRLGGFGPGSRAANIAAVFAHHGLM